MECKERYVTMVASSPKLTGSAIRVARMCVASLLLGMVRSGWLVERRQI